MYPPLFLFARLSLFGFYLQDPHHATIFVLDDMAVVHRGANKVAKGDGNAHHVIFL